MKRPPCVGFRCLVEEPPLAWFSDLKWNSGTSLTKPKAQDLTLGGLSCRV